MIIRRRVKMEGKKPRSRLRRSAPGILGFVLLAGSVWLAVKLEKYAIYRSENPAIALRYPQDWVVVATPTGETLVSFVSPKEDNEDEFHENVDLAVEDLSARPTSLGEFSDKLIKAVESSYNNGRNADLERTTIAGVPAFRYSFETTQRVEMKIVLVWFIKNDRAWSLSYTSLLEDHEKYADEVETMIRSIAIP